LYLLLFAGIASFYSRILQSKMAIDYYEILRVSPSAGLAEIKAAYRKLALQYHPDKNPDSKFAAAEFNQVKEAYEILTNPQKKVKYLQERWLARANNEGFEKAISTPEHILMEVLGAGEKICRMDIYRLPAENIRQELNHLLSPENISILNEFMETSINDAITIEMLQIIKVLPIGDQLFFLEKLKQFTHHYSSLIEEKESELSNKYFWETWKPAFIILAVVLLCILIWGTSLNR